MHLLDDALRTSGGLDRWRQMQRFTIHISLGGALCNQRCANAQLKDLVAEGSTREQELEITGFAAPNRRALYRPDWVAFEGSDGRRLKERQGLLSEFRQSLNLRTWDDLELAHYCGCFIWNYITAPFIFADADFEADEAEPKEGQGESLRQLRVRYPPRVVTHAIDQTFYFDSGTFLRRQEYQAEYDNHMEMVHLFSGHQRFSGFLVPTLCRLLSIDSERPSAVTAPLFDVEIFDALFR